MEDFTRLGQLYAKQGDQITCTNGHVCLEFAEDAFVGDPLDPAMFTSYDYTVTPEVNKVKMLRPCLECGAAYHQSYGGLLKLHFKDEGWR